jgi:hypothetical protein
MSFPARLRPNWGDVNSWHDYRFSEIGRSPVGVAVSPTPVQGGIAKFSSGGGVSGRPGERRARSRFQLTATSSATTTSVGGVTCGSTGTACSTRRPKKALPTGSRRRIQPRVAERQRPFNTGTPPPTTGQGHLLISTGWQCTASNIASKVDIMNAYTAAFTHQRPPDPVLPPGTQCQHRRWQRALWFPQASGLQRRQGTAFTGTMPTATSWSAFLPAAR